jgi:hypothetical protein
VEVGWAFLTGLPPRWAFLAGRPSPTLETPDKPAPILRLTLTGHFQAPPTR